MEHLMDIGLLTVAGGTGCLLAFSLWSAWVRKLHIPTYTIALCLCLALGMLAFRSALTNYSRLRQAQNRSFHPDCTVQEYQMVCRGHVIAGGLVGVALVGSAAYMGWCWSKAEE